MTLHPDNAAPVGNSRPVCQRCQRPLTQCICRWITPIQNVVDVLILQHPLETNNAKGSVRLLDLCLQSSSVKVGEQFAPEYLLSALYTPSPSDPALNRIQPILLYPDLQENEAPDLIARQGEKLPDGITPQGVRLVVLDATWRKSRKMLYLNPMLQHLPRLSLSEMPASHYRIRKAHKPDQLSSLEASTYALMRLEHNEAKYLPLIDAFDGFVEQQMQYIPSRP